VHELSLCQALIEQLESVSRDNGGGRVELVRLRLGPLSGVEAALLSHAFPIAAAGSVADGAELDIEPAPVVVQCRDCGASGEVAPNRMLCTACGSFRLRLQSGDEMLLVSVELAAGGSAAAGML
jgi:hydrogenase nickel incorporation protein HypA/HybF